MKSKKAKLIAVLLVSLFAAYKFGYHMGSASRGPLIKFGPDREDIISFFSAPMSASFDPYFTRVNSIPHDIK